MKNSEEVSELAMNVAHHSYPKGQESNWSEVEKMLDVVAPAIGWDCEVLYSWACSEEAGGFIDNL